MTEKLVIVESPIKPNHSTPFWCVLDEKEPANTYTPGTIRVLKCQSGADRRARSLNSAPLSPYNTHRKIRSRP